MSGAHTPGPWAWRWKSWLLHQIGTEPPYGPTVLAPTYSRDKGMGVEISDADRRLIEAAPDLLEALILVNDYFVREPCESNSSVWEAVCAAIAKAKGEKA